MYILTEFNSRYTHSPNNFREVERRERVQVVTPTLMDVRSSRLALNRNLCGPKDLSTSTANCFYDANLSLLHWLWTILITAWKLSLVFLSSMPRVVPPIDGKTNNISASLIESTAGFTAGIVATLVVHPFDILKTRLQCLFSFSLLLIFLYFKF